MKGRGRPVFNVRVGEALRGLPYRYRVIAFK